MEICIFKEVSNMYEFYMKKASFENFKSDVCHHVKQAGDLAFIAYILRSKIIFQYCEKKWYAEMLYLLAMIDYLCRENNLPVCADYDDFRSKCLPEIVYPSGIYSQYVLLNDEKILEDSYNNSIPEFKRFNIVENEVRDIA